MPQLVFAAMFPFVVALCISVLLLYHRRRHLHPLTQRPFRTNMLILGLFTLYLIELSLTYVARRGHPCLWFLIFGWPLITIVINCYMSRVWLTWFKFKATQEKSELRPMSPFARALKSLKKAKSKLSITRPPSPSGGGKSIRSRTLDFRRSRSFSSHSRSQSSGTLKNMPHPLRSYSSFTSSPRISASVARASASRSFLKTLPSSSQDPSLVAVEISRSGGDGKLRTNKHARMSETWSRSALSPAAPPSPRSQSRTLTHTSTLALVAPDFNEEPSRSQLSPTLLMNSLKGSSDPNIDLRISTASALPAERLRPFPGRAVTAPVSPTSQSRSCSPRLLASAATPSRGSPSHSRKASMHSPTLGGRFQSINDSSNTSHVPIDGSSRASPLKRNLTVPLQVSHRARSNLSYNHSDVVARGSGHILPARLPTNRDRDSPRARSTSPVRPHKRAQSASYSNSGMQTPARTLFSDTSFPRGSDPFDPLPPAPPLNQFQSFPSPSHMRIGSDPGYIRTRRGSTSRNDPSGRFIESDTKFGNCSISRSLARDIANQRLSRPRRSIDVVGPLPDDAHTMNQTGTLSRGSGIAASLASHSATLSRTSVMAHDDHKECTRTGTLRTRGHVSDSSLSLPEIAIHVNSASSRPAAHAALLEPSFSYPPPSNAHLDSKRGTLSISRSRSRNVPSLPSFSADTSAGTGMDRGSMNKHLSSTILSEDSTTTTATLKYAQPVKWYLAHKEWATDKFVFRVFGIKGFIEWLAMMLPVFTGGVSTLWEETLDGECFCPSLSFGFIVFQVIIGLNALVTLFAAFRFVRLSDGFYIKRELKYVGYACVVGIAVWNGLTFLETSYTEFPLQTLWMMALVVVIFSVTGLYPLLKIDRRAIARSHRSSRRNPRGDFPSRDITISVTTSKSRSNSALSSVSDLATFLRSEGGAEEFYEHLKLEFSVENLLFWQAVEAFRENFDASDCDGNRLLARHLEQTFIADDSDLQVNLNARECSQITMQIERGEINATLFDRAQRHAYRLMATDSFLRFRTARMSAALRSY